MAADTNQFPTRPGLVITADFAEFRLKEGIFYYSNNVVVTDPPAKPGGPPTILKCGEATARRSLDNKFDSIVALHAVQIEQGPDRARGQRAVYTRSNEWMVLTGPFNPGDTNFPRPYLIRAQDTMEADRIVYDRLNGKIFYDNPKTVILSRGNTNAASTNKSGAKSQFPFPLK